MYDAADRRFMAADPVKERITRPATLSQYSYVVNNPYKYTDPTGTNPRATMAHYANGAGVGGYTETEYIRLPDVASTPSTPLATNSSGGAPGGSTRPFNPANGPAAGCNEAFGCTNQNGDRLLAFNDPFGAYAFAVHPDDFNALLEFFETSLGTSAMYQYGINKGLADGLAFTLPSYLERYSD